MLQWNLKRHSKHIVNYVDVAIQNRKKKKHWKKKRLVFHLGIKKLQLILHGRILSHKPPKLEQVEDNNHFEPLPFWEEPILQPLWQYFPPAMQQMPF
jgi:hypothetical protein